MPTIGVTSRRRLKSGRKRRRRRKKTRPSSQEPEQIPWNLTGKQFEELVLFRARKMNRDRVWSFGRYGVQFSHRRHEVTKKVIMQPLKSLPDFEGALYPTGRQIIVEAKTCSVSSYRLDRQARKSERQLKHLMDRSAVGVLCWLLIHFNGRSLKTKTDNPFTVAIQVHSESDVIVDNLSRGGSISRDEAYAEGLLIEWNLYTHRDRKFAPNLVQLCAPFQRKEQNA